VEHKQCPACADRETKLQKEIDKWKQAFGFYILDNWALSLYDVDLTLERIEFVKNFYYNYVNSIDGNNT
jgi:hypothetical protein